jgi:integrase
MSAYQLDQSKFLSDKDLERLTDTLKRNRYKDPRNVLLLELILATGGRGAEVLEIKRCDIHPNKTVFIKGKKKSSNREIPLETGLYERLLEHCKETKPKELVFPITPRRLRQIWDCYRPVNKGVHCLRHTFALNHYKRTRDLRLIQTALGHKNIQNTMIYADYVYQTEEFRKLLLGEE